MNKRGDDLLQQAVALRTDKRKITEFLQSAKAITIRGKERRSMVMKLSRIDCAERQKSGAGYVLKILASILHNFTSMFSFGAQLMWTIVKGFFGVIYTLVARPSAFSKKARCAVVPTNAANSSAIAKMLSCVCGCSCRASAQFPVTTLKR